MDEASTGKAPRRAVGKAVKKPAPGKAGVKAQQEAPVKLRKAVRGRAGKAAPESAEDARLSPLVFMLRLMRDEARPAALRLSAARAAAPYVHGRHAGDEGEGGDERLRASLRTLIEQVQQQGGGVAALVKQH